MKSAIISCFLFALSSSAFGSVTAFLKPDPIVLIIQGRDSDAKRLFDSMGVSKTEVSPSVFEKKIESPSGQVLIACRESEITQTVSCTAKIKRDQNLEVSLEKKRAYLATYLPEDTEYLFASFTKNNDGNVPMYISEKQDFAYSSSMNRFILSFQEITN